MPFFLRRRPAPPTEFSYGNYRFDIRADFRECCAYCILHELWAGGYENFEIDHFRPQKHFPELHNDYYNLYYSCHVCNHRKGSFWPSEELHAKGIGFVDLCSDDYSFHYRLASDGVLHPLTKSAGFTIDAIRLNRRHLIELRAIIIRQEDIL